MGLQLQPQTVRFAVCMMDPDLSAFRVLGKVSYYPAAKARGKAWGRADELLHEHLFPEKLHQTGVIMRQAYRCMISILQQ